MQRDVILDKYMYGYGISAEEMKFIVDTSKLINSCIDKQFY